MRTLAIAPGTLSGSSVAARVTLSKSLSLAMAVPGASYLNTALALWMFFSGIIYPVAPHIYVGIIGGTLVFIFSLVPTSDRTFWPFGKQPAPSH